jgi:hypothetical protein
MNYLDTELQNLGNAGIDFNSFPSFTVTIHDVGTDFTVDGLVPEWEELQAEQSWLISQLPEDARNYLDKAIRNGFSPAWAFNYALQTWAPDLIPYAQSLANKSNAYAADFCATFGVRGCGP